MSVVTVAYSNLDPWLQTQPVNTAETPYKLNVTNIPPESIKDTTLTDSFGYIFRKNQSKYVDLSETALPSGVNNMNSCFRNCTSLVSAPNIPSGVIYMGICFSGCTSLVSAPNIPSGVTDMNSCFRNCTSLVSAPNIPSGVTNMNNCFENCTSLVSAPNIPSGVTDMNSCFENCTSLVSAPNIPSGVTNMGVCFENCTSLVSAPNIPSGVTNMNSCFSGCTSLVSAPNIPSGVIYMGSCFYYCTSLVSAPNIPSGVNNMNSCFRNCTSLVSAPNIPNGVTDMGSCFSGCTSLVEITNFEADLETLVTNDRAERAFTNCPSLTKIGVNTTAKESTDWHVFRLKFGSNTVEGKVYDKTGSAVTIPQTTITKSTLKLPIKTDELWFPSGYTDAQIDEIIGKMIQYKYTVFNKEVIPPDEKSFVIYADNPDKIKSNIPALNPTDTIQIGNNAPITSNAVSTNLCFSSSGRVLTGASLQAGMIIRVFFTAQQTGSDGSTAMTITYNNSSYPVRAPVNGSLGNFTAKSSGGAWVYCQAYTTLEMYFDGTQFIIIGNPVVISNSDYTVYTDGSITYTNQMKEVLVNNLNDALPDSNTDILFFKSTFQPANLPSYDGNYWFGFTMRTGEANYFLQIAYGLGTTQYARQYYVGSDTWGAWRQI